MFVFLVVTIQLGHGVQDRLTDYCTTVDQFLHTFLWHHNEMSLIPSHPWLLIFHHFSDNRNEPDRTHENSDTRWQI
jgi:hypothetical protein